MPQTIEDLRKQYRDLRGQAVGLQEKAKADGGRDLTEEEGAQMDTWLAEGETVQEGIVAAEEAEKKAIADRNARDERLAGFVAFGNTPQPRRTAPVNPNPPAEGDAYPAGGPHERRGRPNIVGGPDSSGFASFGEMLIAVRRVEEDHFIDPRLKSANDFAPQAAASGASESVPSDGGFLVEQQTMAGLWEKAYQNAPLLNRIETIGIGQGFNGVKINGIDETSRADGSRFGGVRAYWAAEAATVTATKPTFNQLELDLKKLFALYYATDEVLADATALQSVVSRVIPLEMQFKLENGIINGTGAGQPLGVINAGSLVSVAIETGQAAATVNYDNICKMWARMWAPSMVNAVWLINQALFPQLFKMSITIGTGGAPVYLPPGGASSSPYGSLFGRPVIPVEYCAAPGTVGDILLVDLSQYQGIDKGGLQTATSMHVRFIYGEMTYRFTFRFDGQPMWKSALTPFKGSDTLTPFVALAARA